MKTFLPAAAFVAITLIDCSALKPASEERSGAELWSLNCSRCHNIPGPAEFTAPEWEIIGSHMRERASIGKGEIERIVAFLKAASPDTR